MTRTAEEGVRYTLNGTWDGTTEIASIFEAFVLSTGVGNRPAAILQYATLLSDGWVSDVLPQVVNNYQHQSVDWVDLDTTDGTVGTFARATPGTGGLTTGSAPVNNAVLVHKNLSVAVRGERAGRLYIPGCPEVDVGEDGRLSSAYVTALNAALALFLTSVTVPTAVGDIAQAGLRVFQWPSIEVPQPTKRIPNPDGVGIGRQLSSLSVDVLIATQRRRLR